MTCYVCNRCNKCGIFSNRAVISCAACGTEVPAGAAACPACGGAKLRFAIVRPDGADAKQAKKSA